jgi:hypothetical protein
MKDEIGKSLSQCFNCLQIAHGVHLHGWKPMMIFTKGLPGYFRIQGRYRSSVCDKLPLEDCLATTIDGALRLKKGKETKQGRMTILC